LFFSEDEIIKSLPTWDGKPASLNHPQDGKSLTLPEVFNEHWVGFVFGTKYEPEKKRLVSEIWLNKKRSSDIINKVNNGDGIDVSIGAYGDVIKENGSSGGVEYHYKIMNMTGDHLAILPNSEGACGWEDGCGIRAKNTLYYGSEGTSVKKKKETKVFVAAILKSAREPSYSGVETASWEEVEKNLSNYYDGYKKEKGISQDDIPMIKDMSPEAREWIASKSLLGDPDAEDFKNLLFFPVVNPATNKLSLGALRAVISGRGSQAEIEESVKKSAQDKARKLLDENNVPEEEEKPKDEGVEMNLVTAKDILNRKDEFCPEVIDVLRESISIRNKMIEDISGLDVKGVSLTKEFLETVGREDLKALYAFANSKADIAKTESPKDNTDFSLSASFSNRREATHLEPRPFKW